MDSREKSIESEIRQRTIAKDRLERQLMVMRSGGPEGLRIMNEVKRMSLEIEAIQPELHPLRLRILDIRVKATGEGTEYQKLTERRRDLQRKLEQVSV